MAMAFEVLGLSPMGSAMVPAAYEDKNRVATEAGALIMDVLARGQRPRDIITREGLENAIAAIATSGGSTNGVLHLLALAREAGVELDIDDFDRIAAATPTTCDLKPGGRFVAKDLYEAGGIAVVAKRLLEAGMLHEDAQTVTGRTIGEHAREAVETPGQEVVRPARRPGEEDRRPGDPARQPRAGGLASSSSPATSACTTAAPRACSSARRTRWRPSPRGAIVAGDVVVIRNEGPAGGPGMREMLARHGRARGGGAGRATSRCSPTAASPAPRAGSWPATSRPRRSSAARSPRVQDGDTITIDVANRRMDVELADDEIAAPRRRVPLAAAGLHATACWRSTRSWCRSASEGAVTRRSARDLRLRLGIAGQELPQQLVEARRPLDHRRVPGVLEDLDARVVADQPLVALRVADGHEQVVAAPHDQHRDLDRRQPVAVGVARAAPSSAGTKPGLPQLSTSSCASGTDSFSG